MASRRNWLPREGFTLDVVQSVIQNTLLNPFLTVPLWLLARYYDRARGVALDHPLAFSRLKFCMYIGLARLVNSWMNQGALNNWRRAKFQWDKELVVVTGGSDGFGKLLTLRLVEKGSKVIVLDVQNPTYDLPSNVHFFQVDLTDPAAIKSTCDAVKAAHGDPTVVVNNAGIANHQTILDLSDTRLQRVVAVNQLAPFRIVREFLPAIIAKNHGMFVTVASLAGYVVPAGLVDYCSTKGGAVAFHEGLASELAHRYEAPAVRTIMVAPNFAATKLAEGFVNKSKFVSPTLQPETVVDAIFEQMMSGNSGHVVLPRIHIWMAQTARAWPWWLQKGLSRSLAEVMRPYNKLPPRDEVDPELYRLWIDGKISAEDLNNDEYKKLVIEKASKEEIMQWIETKKAKS